MALPLFQQGRTGSRVLNAFVAALESALALKAASHRVPSLALAAPVNAVASSLTTELAGDNNDLVITAKTKGVAGDAITLALVDPGANDAALAIAVAGTAITASLATGADGAITTTAAQLKAAIEASAAAAALVTVANAAANNGTGVVTALAATPLAGGVNGTLGAAWEQRYYGGYIYVCAADAGNTIADANWQKWQLAAA